MLVYHFDQVTGQHVGMSDADASPLEPGVYLIPAFATDKKPPVAPEGKFASFDGSKWALRDIPTPEQEPEPEPVVLTDDQRIAALRDAVQEYIDAKARTMGYDDIKTAVTYAEEPSVPQFQKEGRALRAWRSVVWESCYQLMGGVKAGKVPEPTSKALLELLPTFTMEA